MSAITIARRDQERPLHPKARRALEIVLGVNGYDPDDRHLILDDVDEAEWVMLPNGRRELRDMADDIGLFAFVTVTLED